MLIKAKEEGKRICGYGAPGKGNTLLNYAAIGTISWTSPSTAIPLEALPPVRLACGFDARLTRRTPATFSPYWGYFSVALVDTSSALVTTSGLAWSVFSPIAERLFAVAKFRIL